MPEATTALGLGMDKPDVRFVAHLDLPKNMENHYQETGQAGRDGSAANAWMAYELGDVAQLQRLIERSEAQPRFKRLAAFKLDELPASCEATTCRRARPLNYFGEGVADSACGNCDICHHPIMFGTERSLPKIAFSCIYILCWPAIRY